MQLEIDVDLEDRNLSITQLLNERFPKEAKLIYFRTKAIFDIGFSVIQGGESGQSVVL